jgi:type II secretory pathway pseudopilin PulG
MSTSIFARVSSVIVLISESLIAMPAGKNQSQKQKKDLNEQLTLEAINHYMDARIIESKVMFADIFRIEQAA